MKKLLTLSTFFLLSIMTFASALINGIYYDFSGTEATVVSGRYSGSVVIPASVKQAGVTYSVTRIGANAFSNSPGITSITIPNSVKSIGDYAFNIRSEHLQKVIVSDIAAWCGIEFGNETANPLSYAHHLYSDDNTEITELVIPDGVTSIGNFAFYGCSGLTSITIPNSVTSIGYGAFQGCSGLTSIEIPNSVTSIGNRAFYGCSGLTSVTIPYSVTSIGNNAFRDCSGLTSVTIPGSVTSIGVQAFWGCSKLTLVESRIGKVFGIADNIFSSDTYNNAELRVPRDLSSMYKQAEGWKNFKSITEGNVGVCGNNLTYTYSEVSGKLTIQGTGAMYDYSSSSPAPWNSYKGDIITIVIEDGATSVGSDAFSGCSNLYSVTFGKDVKTVGSSAFENCSALKKVIAPDIAAWCGIEFGDAVANPLYYVHHLYSDKSTEITELVIPDGVTSIGSYAFDYCSGLTSITIPNSVTSIGDGAFWRCSALTSVTIGSGVTSIGSSAFEGCSGLTSVTIPNSVTSIGGFAFFKCSGLTSIEIPNSVTSIGGYTFIFCSGLTSVTIPNSVTSIGSEAFRGCSGLTSVTIGTGVTSIENSAFSECSKLASVTFHCNNVGTWFSGKSSIKEVWIEKEVTSIAQQSFAGCSGLQSVYNNAEDVFTIPKNTFDDATYSSAKLYVPTGMKATYEETPWWLNFNKMEEYDFPTGITIPQQSKDVKVVDAYQINGLKTDSMQKGLNILKMSDGTTIKVVK